MLLVHTEVPVMPSKEPGWPSTLAARHGILWWCDITLLVLQRLHLRRTLHPVAFDASLRILQADLTLADELR